MSVFSIVRTFARRGAAALIVLLLINSTCATAHAGGLLTILRVGAGAGCDFASLQGAINAASTQPDDLAIIRLTAAANNQSLTVFNRNVTIDGRYPNCTSEVPSDTTLQTIDGNDTESVVRITNNLAGRRSVTLRNIVVRDGGSIGIGIGGGVSIGGPVDVTILGSRIGDNQSTRGGGIFLNGSTLTIDENTIIGAVETLGLVGNRAIAALGTDGQGGGISCVGGGIITINDGRIRTNSSTDDGGGIHLSDCTLHIEPRPAFVGDGDGFVTLFENIAGRNGGGLYATNGSDVFWRSLPTGSFGGRASGNSADNRGGAVFLTGLSNFVGDWLRFEDSLADGRGGGFSVEDTSNLLLRGGSGFACDGANCPGIFGTRGITIGESATLIGGAIYADTGGNVDLRQMKIHDNFSNNGSALHLSGSATTADLHSVLIARNVLYGVGNGTSTIELTSSAKIEMRHVTMMGNFRASDQFPGLALTASSIRANGNSSTVELRNSILWNDAEQVLRVLVGATSTGSCVFAHENSSFTPATVNDPLFVDTTGNDPDFSLQLASPAIDRCAVTGTNEADIFGLARPQDMLRPDFFGPYDAGAIERPTDDVIFRNGFELLNK